VKTTLGLKRKVKMDRWLEEWTDEVMRSWDEKEGINRSTAIMEVA
tara:strand:+ start:2271 stop:2405 length:135 start_codon:yes stop_codon:yes gene_type:complete